MKKTIIVTALCLLIGSAFSVPLDTGPKTEKSTAVTVVETKSQSCFLTANDFLLVEPQIVLTECEVPAVFYLNVVVMKERSVNTFYDHRIIYRYKPIINHIRPPTGLS